MIRHHEETCTSCGACLNVCPRHHFYRDAQGMVHLSPGAADNCLGCGHCIAACPCTNVLSLGDYRPEQLPPVTPPPAPDRAAALLRTCRSVRNYADAPTDEQLTELLETARYCPTGHNSQDVCCTVIRDRDKIHAAGETALAFYQKLLMLLDHTPTRAAVRLVAGRNTWQSLEHMAPRLRQHVDLHRQTGRIEMTWDAPCLILVHGPKKTDSATNAVIAGHAMILHAHSLGLGSCILGMLQEGLNHNRKELKRAGIAIPDDHTVHLAFSLGVPAPGNRYHRLPPRRAVTAEFV